MKRYCLALDLKDNEELIAEYEKHHKSIWPEVRSSIIESGVVNMEIYRLGRRLFMIMDVTDSFSFSKKSSLDQANPYVKEWEALMSRYQEPLPEAAQGEKWVLMKQIFKL